MNDVPSDPESFFVRYLPEALRASPELAVGITSAGSVTCRVIGSGEWSLRLKDGVLEAVSAQADDVILQLTVAVEDFETLIVEPTRAIASGPSRPIPHGGGALAALSVGAETAKLVRRVPGSVLFVARDGETERRVLVTPGERSAEMNSAECTIECALSDVMAIREGGPSPMQLFTTGKLRLRGNIQIAMALAGIFAR